MAKKGKIVGTPEVWETGKLGQDEAYVRVAKEIGELSLDEDLELRMISIRLQKSLIDDLKWIAKIHGIGYQPLIKQILKRFTDSEKRRLLREAAYQVESDRERLNGDEEEQKKVVG